MAMSRRTAPTRELKFSRLSKRRLSVQYHDPSWSWYGHTRNQTSLSGLAVNHEFWWSAVEFLFWMLVTSEKCPTVKQHPVTLHCIPRSYWYGIRKNYMPLSCDPYASSPHNHSCNSSSTKIQLKQDPLPVMLSSIIQVNWLLKHNPVYIWCPKGCYKFFKIHKTKGVSNSLDSEQSDGIKNSEAHKNQRSIHISI